MDGGMDNGVFKIFVEELFAILPIAAITTVLNILLCLTLPPSFALPLCTVCMSLGVIASSFTIGSNIDYMLRGFARWEPEGMFARFCIHFDDLVCNGVLMTLAIIGYGAAYEKLGIDFAPSKQGDDKMNRKAMLLMLRALCLETDRAKIPYFAAGMFCFSFSSISRPRFISKIFPLLLVGRSFGLVCIVLVLIIDMYLLMHVCGVRII
jgi:hypothetical protein